MTTLQLMSDLHLEFLNSGDRRRFFKGLISTGVDVLVLAGDICSSSLLEGSLKEFCDRYPHVVYITGNHEFYGSSPTEVHGLLWDVLVDNKNLTWLDNESAEVAGLKFVGGTLWFPFPEDGRIRRAGREGINDFNLIHDFEPWVYDQNQLCELKLESFASEADVVVTHHLPSSHLVSPRYRTGPGSELNHFFCRDLTDRIKEWQPKLWLFGHTHDRIDMTIGKTRFVCNAKGYPHESESEARGVYQERCIIEIPSK